MADVYQFSECSLGLLEKCIGAGKQPGQKWMELFKPEAKEDNWFNDDEDTIILENLSEIEAEKQDTALINSNSEQQKAVAEIGAILELSSNANHLIIGLDLLVKSYKMNPEIILAVFIDIDIPNKLIEEFFKAVDEKERLQFLQSISSVELPPEVFHHRLTTISSLYKSSRQTTFDINNFILNGLMVNAQVCQQDRIYGQCMLAFFKTLNVTNFQFSKQSLELLVGTHKTAFKGLCQNILNQLNKKH